MEDERYLLRIEASMALDVNLYRGGNAETPRFDSVRDKDIVKYKDPETGLIKVKGMSGEFLRLPVPNQRKTGIGLKPVQLSLLD